MPNIENQTLSKLYYSIGEVAELLGVNASLLRFWEKEFNLAVSKKNKKGNRLYTTKEIDKIRRIYQFVKVEGYTLDGAKKAMKSKVTSQVSGRNNDEEEKVELNVISETRVAQPNQLNTQDLISRLEQIKNRLRTLSFENESQNEMKSPTTEPQAFQEIKNDPATILEAPAALKTVAPKPKAAPRSKPAANEGPTLFDF
ncbi:MAG: hypothetical protein RIR55_1410 [Bacteroidota bacterium]|jgi:DNA-binding transcriptional MerR regulator